MLLWLIEDAMKKIFRQFFLEIGVNLHDPYYGMMYGHHSNLY